jgi:hypothetical protein
VDRDVGARHPFERGAHGHVGQGRVGFATEELVATRLDLFQILEDLQGALGEPIHA